MKYRPSDHRFRAPTGHGQDMHGYADWGWVGHDLLRHHCGYGVPGECGELKSRFGGGSGGPSARGMCVLRGGRRRAGPAVPPSAPPVPGAGGRQEGRGQHERVQRARLRRRHAEVRRPLYQQVLAWPGPRATQGSQVRSRGYPTRKKNKSYYMIIK